LGWMLRLFSGAGRFLFGLGDLCEHVLAIFALTVLLSHLLNALGVPVPYIPVP
jgi:hypothetical protein